ncbi:MAG: hypothetical protein QM791_02965 [Ferruginibacter sp.]
MSMFGKSSFFKKAIAFIGLAGIAQAMPATASVQAQHVKVDNIARDYRRSKTVINPFGGLDIQLNTSSGIPPKYYGQMLQRTGKQKWTKRKR